MVHVTTGLMLKRIQLDNNEFITREKLLTYCREFRLDYNGAISYYLRKSYLVRIFRGIFYVRSPEELRLGRQRYNHLEMVAKGLELKSVEKWYFGLYTALKLNNMTHEYFNVEDVVSTKLLRVRPVTISEHKFKFTRISSSLYGFGITEKRTKIKGTKLKYSDPEKTILDFVYLWRYRGFTGDLILFNIADWTNDLSKRELANYSKRYPASVRRIVEGIE